MKIELCVASVEAIECAKTYGFDRMELCQNLEAGGLTPSAGLIRAAIDSCVSVHVLIRSRIGDFSFSDAEINLMAKDIEMCREMGVDGVVVGALKADGSIDLDAMSIWMKSAGALEVTFHRAMDEADDFKAVIDSLIDLGVKRVLTSGGKESVVEGEQQLVAMKAYANNRIEIMCGGGVKASNVGSLVKNVQPDAIHFSGTSLQQSAIKSIFSSDLFVVDHAKIENILAAIQ